MNQSLKQPKALSICFLTEMWERFGYILIQTLLVFVLIQEFGYDTGEAGKMVGAFTGMLFVTSVLAGLIADFFLGYLRAVIIGSILLFAGYFCISISKDYTIFCLGLAVICIGTGLLKTNVSGFLGNFYDYQDKRRDVGYTIFFIGINLGPIIAAITSTYIQNTFHLTHVQPVFYLASAAVLLSGIIFYAGYKYHQYPLARQNITFLEGFYSACIIIAGIAITMWVIYSPTVSNIFFILISILCIATLLGCSRKTKEQILKTSMFILFLVIGILYFVLYNQIFISINIFNALAVNKSVFGLTFSPQAFVSIDNLGVIIFGLMVLKLWKHVSDTNKFLIGSFFMVITFLVLLCSVIFTSQDNATLVSPWWVILAYTCLAFSEICIGPIGLALATKFAPKNRNGLFIGAWLVAIGVGGQIAGIVSKNIGLPDYHDSIQIVKTSYQEVFIKFFILSIILLVVTYLLKKVIERLEVKRSQS